MKILHVQGAAQLAGCERTCELFIRSTPWAQHHVVVMGGAGPAVGVWEEGRAEVSCLDAGTSRTREYSLLAGVVRKNRPDAVVLWTASRLGIKIAACRAAGVERIVGHVGNPIRLSFLNAVAAEAYALMPRSRQATLVAVSQHVLRSYQDKSGFRHFKSEVIHNAIATDRFAWQPEIRLPERVRVGMIARLDSIKDHATLFRAWRLVLRQRPNWRLEVAGGGPLRAPLERLAEDLNIREQITFLGWIQHVPEVVRAWSAVVHSTTADEGLGNSMLEAMAIGRPLVATNVGPVAEITDRGRVARLAQPGDPEDLSRLILDVEAHWALTREQVLAARDWVERYFSPLAMVRGYFRCLGMEFNG